MIKKHLIMFRSGPQPFSLCGLAEFLSGCRWAGKELFSGTHTFLPPCCFHCDPQKNGCDGVRGAEQEGKVHECTLSPTLRALQPDAYWPVAHCRSTTRWFGTPDVAHEHFAIQKYLFRQIKFMSCFFKKTHGFLLGD